MKIEKNTVVSLTYRLTESDDNGSIIEEVDEKQPFVFLYGSGNLIPGFENNVKGLSLGDSFAFGINAADAYGAYDENGVVELQASLFHHEGKFDEELCKVGNIIPMRNESGQQFNGKIKDIKGDVVVMDFNHPLAGKDLYFKGKVVDVRMASEDELNHGHIHDHGEHDGSCGCGCDN